MDWLAGSRQHILELIITRTLVLAPIYVLGFSKEVIDAYIVIVGFQAVFNHANVSVRLGPLGAHFAFIDHAFGTAHKADRPWPAQYGVVGDYVPNGFFKQLAFPFVWKR
jgi:sterol desaturase/sphingolipid hydroxylase (fatty acid hydroxylase superfamily)